MNKRVKQIIGGAAGGMAGGLVMSIALTAARRSNLPGLALQNQNPASQHPSELGKRVLISGLLGGIYGAIRAGLNLPGLIAGPLYGLVSYGLSTTGLGPTVEKTPGPWNKQQSGMISGMIQHTVYGMVTDSVAGFVERLLS